MIRGLYTAASGMLAQWERVNVLANNVANADTTGFKVDEALVKAYPTQGIVRTHDATLPFDPVPLDLRPQVGVLGTGAQVEKVVPLFTQGPLQKTDQKLDVALVGRGLLALQTPNGIRYTRDGSLSQDNTGLLVSRSGYPVLGRGNTPIQLAPGDLTIDKNGTVYLDGTAVNQLQVVEFQNPSELLKRGENLFAETPQSGAPAPSPQTQVEQGFLEKPNMNVVMGAVEMIKAFHTYEANSRVVQTTDATLDRLINNVGNTISAGR